MKHLAVWAFHREVSEPYCCTGNFFGLLPESMAYSKLHGVEIDPLTGEIAKHLYQKAKIAVEGFEDTKLLDNHFDVVIDNVTLGDIRVNDSQYNSHKFLMNSYFVKHPEMVLGRMELENTRLWKLEPTCKADKDRPLLVILHEAMQRINGEIPEMEIDEISDE